MKLIPPTNSCNYLSPNDMQHALSPPASPQTLSSIEPRPSKEDEEGAKIRQWWGENIIKSMGLPEGYRQVHVLMIKWHDEIDELKTRDEVDELSAVFRDIFNYEVTETQIGDINTQLQLEKDIMQWLFKNSSKDNLLIVYYAGHGTYCKETKQLIISPTIDVDDVSASWFEAERIFSRDSVKADTLLIMDCCYASDTMRHTLGAGRAFLLIAASEFGKTTPSPGDHSFTRSLITVLRQLANEHMIEGFDTWDIIERVKKLRISSRESNPEIHRKLKGSRQINLRRWNRAEWTAVEARYMPPFQRSLRLEFALKDKSLSQEQVVFLTKKIPKLFKKAHAPLADVRFLAYRKVNGWTKFFEHMQKHGGDLSKFTSPTDRKRTSDEAGMDNVDFVTE